MKWYILKKRRRVKDERQNVVTLVTVTNTCRSVFDHFQLQTHLKPGKLSEARRIDQRVSVGMVKILASQTDFYTELKQCYCSFSVD